ncbi:MAG TPA: guanylate kinase [Verrucomicrobiae bacterium]|nr:guanylate kinase [Verrucomicrobiae bacterium]
MSNNPKSKVQNPKPPKKNPAPLLILISAPSGGGKTTLVQQLLRARKNIVRAVTCTTREPRKGEKHGSDYYFLKAGDFLKRVQAGNFLEHATVYGNSYGLLKSELLQKLRQGKDVLLNVDVQGAATICKKALEEPELKHALVTIFLTPTSLAEIERRLKKRGADSPEVIRRRVAMAKQEIAQWKNFDYLLISTSKEEDLRRTLAIIEAEKMHVKRSQPPNF